MSDEIVRLTKGRSPPPQSNVLYKRKNVRKKCIYVHKKITSDPDYACTKIELYDVHAENRYSMNMCWERKQCQPLLQLVIKSLCFHWSPKIGHMYIYLLASYNLTQNFPHSFLLWHLTAKDMDVFTNVRTTVSVFTEPWLWGCFINSFVKFL